MELERIYHLYKRAGFGITYSEAKKQSSENKKQVINNLFNSSSQTSPLNVPIDEIKTLFKNNPGKLSKDNKMHLRKISRRKLLEFNRKWLYRMGETDEALRERMTLFWTNHFVVRERNIIYFQSFNNMLRQNALGNFREIVIAVAKEAAMLNYLNNQQNRKKKPNENFARELMELFTLGEGHYSEKDIQEAARAFTGWRHNFKGDFVFNKKIHDFGSKTFMGRTGNFNGEDILDIILEQSQCAYFISKKIYSYFVSEKIDKNHIEELASVFRKNYDIAEIMHYMFSAEWFYDKKIMGNKIKSPTDLLVGMMQIVPFKFKKTKELAYVQKLLGQQLLNPPNVAGWPGGRKWIDSNTMLVRLKLPSVLLNNGIISFDVKGEFEDSLSEFNKKKNVGKKLDVESDWNFFNAQFKKSSYAELNMIVLGANLHEDTEAFIDSFEKESKADYCIQLMSMPEYQLC
ncbi:hypothetical protein HME9304_02456 [Flagellimonas maritima]|uniref:DUF1800 domain-containing protein n=1 Tax=Flagellimonas maritima TaxID=1383885 RepID=A0A2Z4LUL8_9FLAO|nr:DUF1800 domain-containing protein [Allomuricauda aurantiaca]AWX45442.1 hypothetical protein HME9304_02456 [Allomuricauda aurantiaca]